tara:strand:+ start:289 stop:849 length:561 start_codon:yes stop_codon:yes gene_type:complete
VNIIIFGPPGAGKGTQSKILVDKLNSFQVSTGDMLREEINNNTEIGKKIIDSMDNGKFVDDEIVNKLLEKIIFDPKKNKLIFDGYPRTLNQAKNLEALLKKSNQSIDHIFFLNVDKDAIIKRIEKRKILEKRPDDDSVTILKRYDIYMKETKPVLDFYSSHKGFHEIDGSLEIDEITGKIGHILNV